VTTLVLAASLLSGFTVGCADEDGQGRSGPDVFRARAVVRGARGIRGEVVLVQAPAGRNLPVPPVRVVARIRGLPEGSHGFHIHERGSCDPPGFTSSGGHFDPGPFGNPSPDVNHPYHAGDLPNLEVGRGGTGRLTTTTSRVTLSPGPLSIFDADGSAVIVHEDPDQGRPGVSGASGGARLACGVIRLQLQE
jgi:Cu-Zn family superoxide dismutase